MAKLSLTDVTATQNQTSLAATINSNHTKLETALEKTLSRDGTSPNSMEADLDMNSMRIFNLPDAESNSEPFTYGQAQEIVNLADDFSESIATVAGYAASALDSKLSAEEEAAAAVVARVGAEAAQLAAETAAAGAGVTDGDKGDITVSGTGTTWTVDAAVPETKRFTPSGTGAVTRTIQAKLREIASVKDFGATGDGSTDDTAPLNLAIAALNAGTISRLHFPAGAYKTTAALSTITRSSVSLTGDGPRLSYIYPAAAVNALAFSSTTPTTARISDIYISGLGVDYGAVTAPAAGIALVMTRADRVYVDTFDVRNAFAGVAIQGGADQHYSNITIAGATSWSAVQSGSYSVRLSHLSGTTEVPSEIFFDNFNFKGYMSAYGATAYQAHCIIAECFDGIFMANGHVGFSSSAALFVNPQNNSALSCYNLQCDNVYFDGNGGGLSSGYMVWISGSSTPNVAELSFDNCTFRNWAGTALWTDAASLRDLRISGCSFTDNGRLAAGVVSTSGFGIDNCNFRNNNTSNQSSDCISLQYCSAGVVSGNRILGGAYTHANGVNVISASDIVIANNVLGVHTSDITVASSCSRVKSRGNLKNGSVPTVASAATTSIPAGYDVVSISGTTGISTINGPTQYGDTVTLHFSGVLTVADGTGNIKLAGTFTSTTDSTLTLMYLGSAWTEVSRAVV